MKCSCRPLKSGGVRVYDGPSKKNQRQRATSAVWWKVKNDPEYLHTKRPPVVILQSLSLREPSPRQHEFPVRHGNPRLSSKMLESLRCLRSPQHSTASSKRAEAAEPKQRAYEKCRSLRLRDSLSTRRHAWRRGLRPGPLSRSRNKALASSWATSMLV